MINRLYPGDLVMMYNRTLGMVVGEESEDFYKIDWLTKEHYQHVIIAKSAVHSWRENYLYQRKTGKI